MGKDEGHTDNDINVTETKLGTAGGCVQQGDTPKKLHPNWLQEALESTVALY